ncbi:MAG: HPr(Ser) kinase/phosphatase [Defluviitaleaceae bacterium]|nr:HPr(Ser) kinase/phosphatase [Defluviitaleaceae bacterium]
MFTVPLPTKPEPIPLSLIVSHFNLKSITPDIEISNIKIDKPSLSKPSLALTGFYEEFEHTNIQILGVSEAKYLETLSANERNSTLSKLFSYKIPCFILSNQITNTEDFEINGIINEIPIYTTDYSIQELMGELVRWLKIRLNPSVTIHGVLLDIFGEGVVIVGGSGIGKSETALNLIKSGHRLIADDAVDIKYIAPDTLMGFCPNTIKHFIEIRGIGIIDVSRMFGVGAIKESQRIDMIIKLEHFDDSKKYNRLGVEDEYIEILSQKVIVNTIPIRPGRNISTLCETCAINNRQKKMGYNAAQILNERINNIISSK